MLKKIVAALAAATLVAFAGLFAVGTVFAEEPTPTPTPGARVAAPGPWGRICRGAGVVADAVTNLLGMTRQEILEQRAAGKTLSQIANEKGVTDQQVIDAMVTAYKARLDEAVKNGRLTQAQADWLLARFKALAPFELTNPFAPGAGRRGMMRGGHGCWGKNAPTPTPSASS
jgi:uncharacterized protein (DUF433 family)